MVIGKLEFLKQAIESTAEEVIEEVELLLEESDPKKGLPFIIERMKELLDTAHNLEKIVMEDGDSFIEGEDMEDEIVEEDGDLFEFEIGEIVWIRNSYFPDDERIYTVFGYDKKCDIYGCGFAEFKGPKAIGTVLRRRPDPIDDSIGCYIVVVNGKMYFCPPFYLEKI